MDIRSVGAEVLLGRWVRSPSKYDNWDAYMEWFGMTDEELIRKETAEPQVHVFRAFTDDAMTILHILPERDGLQVEYTVPMDGEQYEIPPIMVKNARSSWKANATWAHSWDERGLKTYQVLSMPQGKFILRYWRSMLSHTEIKISVELSDFETDTLQLWTNRYFHKQPYLPRWTAACAQFFSGPDVPANTELCASYIAQAKQAGASLVVLPENSNRERDYFEAGKPSKQLCYERCEAIDGPFVAALRAAAQQHQIWVVVGVDLRGKAADGQPCVHIGQLLIGPDGFLHGVHKKHVLWDYEYTLFEPSGEPYVVYDTELGRLGLLVCADGIVPEAARVLGCMGAQVLCNSLNSRGPDELRLHIPCRAIENHCWHVSSNTVGNPNNTGLLWPWTGGSQIVAPDGTRVAQASETDAECITAQIELLPWTEAVSAPRPCAGLDVIGSRRPELYGLMTTPLDEVPAAGMYGPVPDQLPAPVGKPASDEIGEMWLRRGYAAGAGAVCNVALMQLSKHHTAQFTLWAARKQVAYAGKRGADLGVLPSLFCFGPDEVAADPAAAAEHSATVLSELCSGASEHRVWLACTLVEQEGELFYHTGYLIAASGEVVSKYRKSHLSHSEKQWATPGDALSQVTVTPWGAFAMMIGDEIWVTELPRCLALAGAEVLLHPTSWNTADEPNVCAVERCSENRVHIVSVTRLDCAGSVGSQVCYAGEFLGDEPIPLMRYPTAVQARHGVEEQLHVQLRRREAHCKMMGHHLDVLHKRFPECYHVLCTESTTAGGESQFWWMKS